MCYLIETRHIHASGKEYTEEEYELCEKARARGNIRCTGDDVSTIKSRPQFEPRRPGLLAYGDFPTTTEDAITHPTEQLEEAYESMRADMTARVETKQEEQTTAGAQDDRPEDQGSGIHDTELDRTLESADYAQKDLQDRKIRPFRMFRAIADLRQLLSSGDLARTSSLLESDLEGLAHGEYEWLSEVRDMGYSYQQIAEALIIDKSRTPWICFSPRSLFSSIQAEYHRNNCAHSWEMVRDRLNTREASTETVLIYDHMRLESADIRRIVSEMCGLGGVVPLTDASSDWNEQVSFRDANSIAEISYDSTQRSKSLRIAEILERVQSAVDALSNICGWLQEQDLCCNSFTALVQTQADEIVETVSIPMGLIDRFRTELIALKGKGRMDEDTIHIADTSHEILSLFLLAESLPDFDKDDRGTFPDILDILDRCALSVQALDLALLSYSNAHVGHVYPFFLKGPLTEIRLLGAGGTLSRLVHLTLRLVKLTCMGDMLGDLVSVFAKRSIPTGHSCHLLASPQDILDTWPPGQFIFGQFPEVPARSYSLCAIGLGGGIIQRLHADSDLLHWHRGQFQTDEHLPISLDVRGKVLIGARIKLRKNCPLNCTKSLQMRCSESLMHNLGTGPDEWRLDERQLGLQAGQYANFSITGTWIRHKGVTLKETYVDLGFKTVWVPFLESFWAVKVSLCTGVAQRVRVREMLSDVMLLFMKAQFPAPEGWDTLLKDDTIVENFRSPNFQQWLEGLSSQKRTAAAEIVIYVLQKLRTTGFDKHRNELIIASVSPEDPCRCFRIRCRRDHVWARALEDSEDCATYAYLTTECLETPEARCRNLVEASWLKECPVFLATAVCLHESSIEKDVGQSNYSLRAGVTYRMGRPGSRLVADLTKTSRSPDPRLYVSRRWTPEGLTRIFEKWIQPEKGFPRLREKGLEKHAEEVLLLTHC